MQQEENTKNTNADAEENTKGPDGDLEQLKRIGDNIYLIAEQLGELNVRAQNLDMTAQEIRNILNHLKSKKLLFFWK